MTDMSDALTTNGTITDLMSPDRVCPQCWLESRVVAWRRPYRVGGSYRGATYLLDCDQDHLRIVNGPGVSGLPAMADGKTGWESSG